MENDIRALVMIVRRAPLQNMAEAEAVSALLDRVIKALTLTKEKAKEPEAT